MEKSNTLLELPSALRIISLNCWGLKFLSAHRHARLIEIARQLTLADPPPHIVGLQEVWTQEDYLAIRELTRSLLPHGKFYWSGVFGGGLAILSQWPIEESSMYRYPLNGRPAAFWRGDWFVGKGVACARIRMPHAAGAGAVVEVFCTHLHAPYEGDADDSYLCHRTAQAWEIAKLMRHAVERGHLVVGLGDFNMVPLSLAHRLVEAHGAVKDVWRLLQPDSAVGSAESAAEKARGQGRLPTARECLDVHGATCDSKFNTWRWSKAMRKELDRGRDSHVDPESVDVKAKRLDYIFLGGGGAATSSVLQPAAGPSEWTVQDVQVGMKMRHPTLKCSLSDHFSIETTLSRSPSSSSSPSGKPIIQSLPVETYTSILSLTSAYILRERRQRRWRERHFLAQLPISIGCLVAVWWSPHNYVAFILMLVSTLGLSLGVLDGLMGFLFVKSELRALKEFEWEINAAREVAEKAQGAGEQTDGERLRVGTGMQ